MRLIFWIKRIINGNNTYCDKCCLNCPHFRRCKRDGFKKCSFLNGAINFSSIFADIIPNRGYGVNDCLVDVDVCQKGSYGQRELKVDYLRRMRYFCGSHRKFTGRKFCRISLFYGS